MEGSKAGEGCWERKFGRAQIEIITLGDIQVVKNFSSKVFVGHGSENSTFGSA
jgi:hypothetical protein